VHERLFMETPSAVHVTTTESFAGEPVEADTPGMQTLLDVTSRRPPSRQPDQTYVV
jgi:hypothetical protein